MNCAKFLLVAYVLHSAYFVTVNSFTAHMYMRVSQLLTIANCNIGRLDCFLLCLHIPRWTKHFEKLSYRNSNRKTSQQPEHACSVRAISEAEAQHVRKKLNYQHVLHLRSLVSPALQPF